ncbi:MAG: hypothetical protein J0H64_00565, partial [Actinobacteria bacterium]|nr:hypothetical protein [Actinomycetota bacterium]
SGTPEDFAELEQQTRQLLHGLGMRPRTRELSDSDLRRTDAAARAALEEILATPRPVQDPDRHALPQRAITARGARRSARRSTAPGRWVVAGLSLAAVVGLGFVVVPPLLDRAGPSATDAADRADASGPASSSMQGPESSTPALPVFVDATGADHVAGTTMKEDAGTLLLRLAEAATRASRHPAEPDGPIQRIVTDSWQLGERTSDTGGLLAIRTERYVLPDGATARVITREDRRPLDASGRVSDGGTAEAGPAENDETFPLPGSDALSIARLDALADDPGALSIALMPELRACPNQTACLVEGLARLQTDFSPRPELTAALWRRLADSDEGSVLGMTTDRLGRTAVAIRVPGPLEGRESVLYADPITGAYLGDDEILTRADETLGLASGSVVAFTAIVSADRIARSQLP